MSSDAYDEYERTDYDRRDDARGAARWVSAVVALAGLWLVVEPFLFDVLSANLWNDVLVGLALLALGGYNYYRRSDRHRANVAATVLVALLGLWLVVSPWVYGVETDFAVLTTEIGFWNDVVVGLVVLVLGVYSAYEARRTTVAPTTG